MRIRELQADEVVFLVNCEEEHLPIKGNASAIDEETDAANEKWIIDQLNAGNEWAWCCVKVTATWRGFEGADYLGGCSYLSYEDFLKNGAYEDMKAEALHDLNAQIANQITILKELETSKEP